MYLANKTRICRVHIIILINMEIGCELSEKQLETKNVNRLYASSRCIFYRCSWLCYTDWRRYLL